MHFQLSSVCVFLSLLLVTAIEPHTRQRPRGWTSDSLPQLCASLGAKVSQAPSFRQYTPTNRHHEGVDLPRTYRTLFTGTGMWNTRLTAPQAIHAMLGSPLEFLASPLFVGYRAHLQCYNVEQLIKVMPNTEENWYGEAHAYFINEVFRAMDVTRQELTALLGADNAKRVPRWDCEHTQEQHAGKDARLRDVLLTCAAVELVNRHWESRAGNTTWESFYFSNDGELERGPTTAEDPYDSLYATHYNAIAHGSYGPHVVQLAPSACPESGNRDLDLNMWRFVHGDDELPTCPDDVAETIIPGYRTAAQVVGYEHRRDGLLGFYKWMVPDGESPVPASIGTDGAKGPLPCSNQDMAGRWPQSTPGSTYNPQVGHSTLVVVVRHNQQKQLVTFSPELGQYVLANDAFQCTVDGTDDGKPVWAPDYPTVTNTTADVIGVLYVCGEKVGCPGSSQRGAPVSYSAHKILTELRGAPRRPVQHWNSSRLCQGSTGTDTLERNVICPLFEKNVTLFFPQDASPVHSLGLCGWFVPQDEELDIDPPEVEQPDCSAEVQLAPMLQTLQETWVFWLIGAVGVTLTVRWLCWQRTRKLQTHGWHPLESHDPDEVPSAMALDTLEA